MPASRATAVVLFTRDFRVHDHPALARALGGALVVRRGDTVRETLTIARWVGARHVFASADVNAYAHRRERRLAAACAEAGRNRWRAAATAVRKSRRRS